MFLIKNYIFHKNPRPQAHAPGAHWRRDGVLRSTLEYAWGTRTWHPVVQMAPSGTKNALSGASGVSAALVADPCAGSTAALAPGWRTALTQLRVAGADGGTRTERPQAAAGEWRAAMQVRDPLPLCTAKGPMPCSAPPLSSCGLVGR